MRFADRRLAAVLIAALWPLAAAAGDLSRVAADGFESRLWIEVNTPEIVVQPGETGVVCYHFLFPIGSTRGVRRWSSTLGENVHHMVLYTSHDANWAPIPHQPPRTLTASDCGLVSAPSPLGWQYVAHDPTQELAMPDDDGNGQPLAMEFVARQPMLLVLYLPNPTSEPIRGSAILRADLLPPDAPYTRTATYLSFNANIAIPPMSLGSSVSATCAAPVGASFWHLSTRTHRRGTLSELRDDATTLVSSSDWENPAVTQFTAPAFHVFSPAGMTYRCTYDNPDNVLVQPGDDPSTQEVCMGIGYFFPATRPTLCVTSTGPL
jgi:hypothetical protein